MLNKALIGGNVVFIVATMGGSCGTGAAPVIAEMAHKQGALSIAVVTRPFFYEGRKKNIIADIANKLKPKKDISVYLLGDGRSEEDIENKILDYFAIKIADELNRLQPEERAKKLEEIQQHLNEGKNPDVHIGTIKEIEKVLTATTVTSISVASLLTGPLTASLFYSGIFAGLWAGVFGMSSSLLLLTGTGVGTLVSLPVLLLLLGSPSYRKTIPVTLQLINIRRRITQMMA